MPKRYFPIVIVVIILAAIALFGYLSPSPVESVPRRILLENIGGKVIFDHKAHEDYGFACADCHHEITGTDTTPIACGACHGVDFTEEWVAQHTTEFTTDAQCQTCHGEDFDEAVDVSKILGRMDAFHQSCMGCHEELGAGPYEQDQCKQCHFQ